MSAAFLRKYATGTGADILIPIVKRGVVDFALGADWTPASGDVKVNIDNAGAADIGTLPVAVTMGNTAFWKFVFTNAELTGKSIVVSVADAATKAVEDQGFIIETYGNASAMHPFDLGTASVAQTGDSYARLGAPAGASVSADIAAVKTDTAAVLADTGTDGVIVATNNDKTGYTASTVSDKTGYSLIQTFPTNFSSLSIDTSGSVKVQSGIKKNVALSTFEFLMRDSTNHAPATGLTITATVSKDGGAFASSTNSATEVGNGIYKISLTQTEMNADKVTLRFAATGADDSFVTLVTDP